MLILLFASALVAATLLPAQSEAVLVALVLAGDRPMWQLLAVATAGNVLGALLNWALGRWAVRWQAHPRFPVAPARLAQARRWYARRGWWCLFAAWVPVIGDPLTLAAGLLGEPLWRFLLVVTSAKGARYLVVALAAGAAG